MIELEFKGATLRQWNTQQRLRTDYPVGTLFSFSQNGTDALDRTAYAMGAQVMCDIPNAILQLSGVLNVYVHKTVEGQLTTILEESFVVLPQPRPRTYINDEAEVQIWHQLESQIRQHESRLDKLEQGGPSDQENAPELIERIDINSAEAGSKSVQRTGYNFREIFVMLHLPHSLDYAKTTRIIINCERTDKSDTDQFRYQFHVQDWSTTAPEKVPADLSMANDVHLCAARGVVYADYYCKYLASKMGADTLRRFADPVFMDERITGVTIEADGTGLEAGSYIEIRAIRS